MCGAIVGIGTMIVSGGSVGVVVCNKRASSAAADWARSNLNRFMRFSIAPDRSSAHQAASYGTVQVWHWPEVCGCLQTGQRKIISSVSSWKQGSHRSEPIVSQWQQ